MSLPQRPGAAARRLRLVTIVAAVVAITWWAARGIEMSLGQLVRNIPQARRLLNDSWPPDWSFLSRLLDPFLETVQIAILGSTVGVLVALPVAVLAARPIAPRRWIYLIDRNFMNILRTLPDLFWAMLFASAVGFGPFAGAIALSVFSVAVVSKLLSESIESIDLRLLEAVEASGGTWFERVRYGVMPQVLPQYVSYALYMFELNIRASVVLGLVGAGGIGVVLNVQLRTFNYSRVAVILIAIFAFVLIIERVSEAARRRLV
ncbi:MAG: phosphonate ABC transporter, permease protein PhnE [Acidobacteriota bacterium]